MAAFINALAEEGTLTECQAYVRKLRLEYNHKFNPKGSKHMSKDECIKELQQIWDSLQQNT